jgi:putative addiction module component (TIGR02574 family)
MDLAATLDEITTLSVDDRLRMIEAIWDSIAAEPGEPRLTEAQQRELEQRLAAHEADPGNVVPWEEVKAAALARARR